MAVTEAINEAAAVPSDAALITAVRSGDAAAYGSLYQRHLGAARRAATTLARTTAEREDLVAEAFTRVLRVIRNGGGPTEEFRPYLLVTMRNAAINANRGLEISFYGEVPDDPRPERDDPMNDRLHAEVAAEAFASLPERWRTVLWHTEVEGDSPAQVAPLLGLTPNSVAALAYRAREGLRQAYLQQYLPVVDRRDCRTVARHLAGWVRRGIAAPKMRRINTHLDGCADCRALADRLSKINTELRAIIGPVVLGAPFALAYVTSSAGSAATSGTVLASAMAQTGASTMGYLSTVKSVFAGTALATAAAVTTILPPPPVPVPNHPPAVSAPVPGQRDPSPDVPGGVTPDRPTGATPAIAPAAPGSAAPGATGLSTPPAMPAEEPAPVADPPTAKEAAKADKKTEKAEAKTAKAEAKAAKQAAKGKDPKQPADGATSRPGS